MSLDKLRAEVCEANQRLERLKTNPLARGEVSGIDRGAGRVVVKPRGLPAANLSPEMMSVVDLNGAIYDGGAIPSEEVIIHLVLYRAFRDIGGVTSTHTTYAAMFAQALRPIPCLGTIHAEHFRGEVPVTRALRKPEIEGAYEQAIGEVIVERFTRIAPLDIPGILVAQHGPVTWGRTAAESVLNSVAMEETARLAFGTIQLDPARTPIPLPMMEKHFQRTRTS